MRPRLYPRPESSLTLIVTADECLSQARVDLDTEGPALLRYAAAAQAAVEQAISTPLSPRQSVVYADGWPTTGPDGGWVLVTGKVQSIDAITYTDEDGLEQTLPADAYSLRDRTGGWLILFSADTTLPTIKSGSEIVVSLTTGWAQDACDDSLRQAVLMLMAAMYDNRGQVPAETYATLKIMLAPFALQDI